VGSRDGTAGSELSARLLIETKGGDELAPINLGMRSGLLITFRQPTPISKTGYFRILRLLDMDERVHSCLEGGRYQHFGPGSPFVAHHLTLFAHWAPPPTPPSGPRAERAGRNMHETSNGHNCGYSRCLPTAVRATCYLIQFEYHSHLPRAICVGLWAVEIGMEW